MNNDVRTRACGCRAIPEFAERVRAPAVGDSVERRGARVPLSAHVPVGLMLQLAEHEVLPRAVVADSRGVIAARPQSKKVRRVTNSTGAEPHPPDSCDINERERVQGRW